MASLVAKKKGNQLYYYLVESARVDGHPRIVHQAYLGSAEKVAALVKDRTSPVPVSAASREFGLPGALWLAAQKSGVWAVLEALWPAPRSGPSPAHYVLLAAIHRICQPGPQTEVADWYPRTILHSAWGIPPERFRSQDFWDVFEQILPQRLDDALASEEDPLDQAQLRLLDMWKEKQMVSRRLLSYDTTNFYTYIASSNTRNELAQRPHNKQGRHNLRQVGLSYVLPGAQPGVRATAENLLVHGQEYLCVLKYSASFASEQMHSLTTSLSKVLQSLRRFSMELNKPAARWKENQIRSKIQRWLSGPFLEELIRYQIESRDVRWKLQFDFDTASWQRLVAQRLGRTVLLTNRMDWTAEQVALGYSAQQDIERVFRGLKDGDWLGWGPMYHWTDRKIRIHAFYCMLGISLLQHMHKLAQAAWDGISMEQLLEELRQIQQFVLLSPPQRQKGPHRVTTLLSKQTLPQQGLAKTLGLDQLHITLRGQYKPSTVSSDRKSTRL